MWINPKGFIHISPWNASGFPVWSTQEPEGPSTPLRCGRLCCPHNPTTAQRRLNRAGRPRRVVTPHVSKTSPVGALQEPRAALWLRCWHGRSPCESAPTRGRATFVRGMASKGPAGPLAWGYCSPTSQKPRKGRFKGRQRPAQAWAKPMRERPRVGAMPNHFLAVLAVHRPV